MYRLVIKTKDDKEITGNYQTIQDAVTEAEKHQTEDCTEIIIRSNEEQK